MKRTAISAILLCFATLSVFSQNIYDARQSVILQATVLENPPAILLQWVKDTANGGYKIWRKAKSDLVWGDSLVALGAGSNAWMDTTVVAGVGYEYQVIKSLPAFPYGNGTPNFGAGYVYAGIKLPPTHARGACLLVIDSTFKQTLAPEILRLLTDIQADGWRTKALYVARTTPVPTLKSYIKAWAETQPDNNLTLFLLGRIPVPYAGEMAPDGHHSDHRGAWPSDGYYACLDGTWTDQSVNITTAPGTRNDNIPGDGKFDNTVFPSPLRLQVGRVDFANMTKFPESEEQLLRRYLNKDHAWRTGKTPVMERGLVDNNFGDIEGLGQVGWRNFSAMFGYSNVKDLPYRQTLSSQSYMWSYGCGGGGPESASDISSTSNFTTDSLQTIFTLLFGSYFGDWDYPNNFLRAAIASRTCLASTWANRPNWYLHHMALGEHIGYSTQTTMTNTGLYIPPYYGIYVHNALMGDPTLRMHMFRPIENLSASQSGLHIQLAWEDPANALGYFVYKKSNTDTTFQLLNEVPVTDATFTDSCAGQGDISYMVRSVALKSSASGTYYNLSTGVTAAISSDPSPFYAVADFNASAYFDALTLVNASLNSQSYHWDFGDGAISTSEQAEYVYSQSGNYTICLSVSDACGSDTMCRQVTILSSLPEVTAVVENALCIGSATGSINLLTTGGTPELDFMWSNLPDTGQMVQNLLPGNYTCTITSETGRSATYGPFTVAEPAAWVLDPVIMMVSPGQSNGSVAVNPQGGCLPYSFQWNTGQTTHEIQGLEPGVYCVTISDCLGCSEVYCATVGLTSNVQTLSELTSYKLYPNPASDKLVLELDFETVQTLKLDVLDATGKAVSNFKCLGKDVKHTWDVGIFPGGHYWIRVESKNGNLLIPFEVAE